MLIGIIGHGKVARTLGKLWVDLGHEVYFGVKMPTDPAISELLEYCGGHTGALSVRELFSYVDLVLLAVRWHDIESVITQASDLNGKILIDCTTPLHKNTRQPILDWSLTSGAERLAAMAPGASVVKCFDTTGVSVFYEPLFQGTPATMFLAGDDKNAKGLVRALAEELGFECVDAGPLIASRHLEAMSAFWVFLAYDQDFGRNFAFKILKR